MAIIAMLAVPILLQTLLICGAGLPAEPPAPCASRYRRSIDHDRR